jgi:hypothetical protein
VRHPWRLATRWAAARPSRELIELDHVVLAATTSRARLRLWSVATGAHLATLIPRPEGWAALLPDGRYKLGGDIAGAFWHVIGLVRFEPGELDPYLPEPLRIPDDEPLLAPSR